MAAAGVQEVKVAVRGGYSPNRIRVRAGTPVRIVFNRQESGECTSRVVFAAFGVSAAFLHRLVLPIAQRRPRRAPLAPTRSS